MDDIKAPTEHISFLSRSTARIGILRLLLDSGPATQREIRGRLDTSRSTVTRALSAHEKREWIQQEDGEYQLTTMGRIITEEFLELVESIRMTTDYSAFLQNFPYDEFDFDVDELSSAEITTSTTGDPYAPARKQTEILEAVDRFRAVLPSIDLEGVKVVHDQIMNEKLEVEIIVSSSVEETISSGEFAPLFREKTQTGRLTVYVYDGELPFYLGLGDEQRTQIGVEDNEGFPRALLDTTTGATRGFGEDVYRDFRDRSRMKPVDEF